MQAAPLRSAFLLRQRGSITVAVVFAVLVGLVLLGVAHLAYSFYMKREMQKGADLAALSAVQVLGMGTPADCARAVTAGRISALANVPGFFATFTAADITVECKVWDSTRADASGMHVFDAASGQSFNAVRVGVRKRLATIIPTFSGGSDGGTLVATTAVATNTQPVAAFSVGSRLLRLERGGLLSQLLTSVGASPAQLDVLDAAGLASVNITPAGLLQALGLPLSVATGVGTPEQLAAVNNLTLGQLLNATLTVIDKAGTVGADVGLLKNAINTVLALMPLNLPVKLFGNGGVLDLSVVGGGAASALQANVNALNILETALVVANGQNLINLGLSVPLLGVDARVRIVEPPTVAIGGVGTQATSAGIRVYLRINAGNIPVVGSILGSLLNTNVDLPIIINVAQSTGTLTKLCEAPLPQDQATISVTSSVANVCLGRFPGMPAANATPGEFASLTNTCEPGAASAIGRYRILQVLGLPFTAKATVFAFSSSQPKSVTLTEPPSPNSSTTINATSIDLAALASSVLSAVLNDLLGNVISTDNRELAATLVGGSATNAGKSIADVLAGLKSDADKLKTGPIGGLLGGTLQLVGNLLGGVVTIVADTTCNLTGLFDQGKIRECRINYIAANALGGASGGTNAGLQTIVMTLLTPVLNTLSLVLNQALNVLGVSIGQTDVSLLSVDCGKPRLVY
jgi:uncharacterized membrane protein